MNSPVRIVDKKDLEKVNEKFFSANEAERQCEILNNVFKRQFPRWNMEAVSAVAKKMRLEIKLSGPLTQAQEVELRKLLDAGYYHQNKTHEKYGTGGLRPVTEHLWVYELEDKLKKRGIPLYLQLPLIFAVIFLFLCVVWSWVHNSRYIVH